MKIGCLAKFLIISTVVLTLIFYILINRFDDLILQPAIKYMYGFAMDGVDKKLQELEKSVEKEKIQFVLQNYTETLLKNKRISINETQKIADSLRIIIADHIIDSVETSKFEKYIQKVIEDERRAKNGD